MNLTCLKSPAASWDCPRAFWWPRGRTGAAAPLNVAESGSKALFGRNLSVVEFLPFLNTPLVVHLFYFSFISFSFLFLGRMGHKNIVLWFPLSLVEGGSTCFLVWGFSFSLLSNIKCQSLSGEVESQRWTKSPEFLVQVWALAPVDVDCETSRRYPAPGGLCLFLRASRSRHGRSLQLQSQTLLEEKLPDESLKETRD